MPLFLHLSIGFIAIIKCLTSTLPKLPHYTNSYGTCHFSQDEKSLYSETEVAPDTGLKAGCWQHDTIWHLSLGWKMPYIFFPGSHKTTSCGALRFQVRSLKHSAMGKPKARNTKSPAKAPRLQRERAKVSGESSAASAPIQQHLHRMCQRTSKASYLQVLDT